MLMHEVVEVLGVIECFIPKHVDVNYFPHDGVIWGCCIEVALLLEGSS